MRSVLPCLLAAGIVLGGTQTAARADFLRGDAASDGRVNIADAVAVLRAIFAGTGRLPCEDAADANDDGRIGIDDAVAILGFLFARGGLPSPGPAVPGPDPTCDELRCRSSPDVAGAVVINEISYNPIQTQRLEFIELHNRTAADIDIGGYRFTDGIAYTIPDDTIIPAGGYVVVARTPRSSRWRRNPATFVGPYEGTLANGGERITLMDGDCVVETVKYDDREPWPLGADGYGDSLERIDPSAPAEDPRSWRASTARGGNTAGAPNDTLGTPPRPNIVDARISPAQPSSSDAVTVSITFDLPAARLARVTLRWIAAEKDLSDLSTSPMEPAEEELGLSTYTASIPPQTSQTMVRYNVEVELDDGTTLILPHEAHPHPYLGYFVYDFEVPSKLPVLWLYRARRSDLGSAPFSGAAIHEADSESVLVFPGAQVRASRQGKKIRFLKGREYRGDRTLNIIREEGGGGTGVMAPQMEHLGFSVFRALGALAPRVDWFRVIDLGAGGKHTQNLVIQQINERFLAMNGLDPGGDLYKLDKNVFAKRTNIDTGMFNLQDLRRALSSGSAESRRQAVLERFDIDNVCMYSVISVLIENWDGFHNNLYAYQDGTPAGRWKVIPWDLDQVFENCCFNFPITYPLNGVFPGNGRTRSGDTRVFSQPYHSQPDLDARYRELLRLHIEPGGPFTVETIGAMMDRFEKVLLDDLELQEEFMGRPRAARRQQIISSYRNMRTYLERRIPYLESVLGSQ